ncbi:MAG TPA: tetratricopeptide repeat protein, partial [Pirellulales bacterium]|nr:tetratricopeptide repeat protein [Pirellulales bacterium]
ATPTQLAQVSDHAAQGDADFQAGNYAQATSDFQHALVDSPNNGGVMLLLGQSLFASGQFMPAAGAVQLAMQVLPEAQWGTVVTNYRELYPNIQNYTDQLRVLEKARTSDPNNAGLRFLLGYHYGYLGYPKNAVTELDQAIKLQPKDYGAQLLRNVFAAKAGIPAIPVTPPTAPPTTPENTPSTQTSPPPAPAVRAS